MPALFPLYVRGALSHRSRPLDPAVSIPSLSTSAAPFKPGRERLQRFCDLVGHRNSELLPLTYPQVLAAPLQLSLLTSPQCPLNPIGIVHIGNSIVLHQPIVADEPLSLTVSLAELGESNHGREVNLTTSADDASGQRVWEAHATLLARYAAVSTTRSRPPRSRDAAPMDPVTSFAVPANTGRRYARVSGDYNPIHLTALSARLFGFKQPIAHGMWSLARVLGVLSDADAPQQVEVCFRRPLLMPAEVGVFVGRGEAHTFALRNRKTGKNYLFGALSEPT